MEKKTPFIKFKKLIKGGNSRLSGVRRSENFLICTTFNKSLKLRTP